MVARSSPIIPNRSHHRLTVFLKKLGIRARLSYCQKWICYFPVYQTPCNLINSEGVKLAMARAIQRRPVQESFQWPDLQYKHDMVVSKDGVQLLNLSQVLNFIFHGRITPYPKKQNDRNYAWHSPVAPGWVHLGSDKDDLVKQKDTEFVRTISTFLAYAKRGYEYMTYGTFRVRKRLGFERSRRRLNSVHAIVIDIDSKNWPLEAILRFCEIHNIKPSFINETPRGYHIWFVLQEDAVGPHETKEKQLTKIGEYYNDINRFLVKLFQEHFPSADDNGVDSVYGGERYIRIPKQIVYFSGIKHSLNHFSQLKRELIKDESKKPKASKSVYLPLVALRKDPAYRSLLTLDAPHGKRRWAALTIALLFYSLRIEKEKTVEFINDWYGKLSDKRGYPFAEALRQVESAYEDKGWESGSHRGAHPDWIFKLTGLRPKMYFTRKKNPDERINKTMDHWTEMFLDKLRAKRGSWMITNRRLCDELGLSSRNMLTIMINELLAKGIIEKEVVGAGGGAATIYRLVGQDPEKPQDPNGKNRDAARSTNIVSIEALREQRSLIRKQSNSDGKPSNHALNGLSLFFKHRLTQNRIEIKQRFIGQVGGKILGRRPSLWISLFVRRAPPPCGLSPP